MKYHAGVVFRNIRENGRFVQTRLGERIRKSKLLLGMDKGE